MRLADALVQSSFEKFKLGASTVSWVWLGPDLLSVMDFDLPDVYRTVRSVM